MRRSRVGVVLVALAMCGCGVVTTVPEDAPKNQADTAHAELVLKQPVHHLGGLVREPMVVEHPDGTLFVSGYGAQVRGVDPTHPPKLWKSIDGGASWQPVDVGTTADGARGNSDVERPDQGPALGRAVGMGRRRCALPPVERRRRPRDGSIRRFGRDLGELDRGQRRRDGFLPLSRRARSGRAGGHVVHGLG